MSDTKLVQIDTETLETLKSAAWLWKCEGHGYDEDNTRIGVACYEAQRILVEASINSDSNIKPILGCPCVFCRKAREIAERAEQVG